MCVNHKYQNLKSYKYFQELSDKGIDGWGKMKRQRDMQAPTGKSTAAFDEE
jgi:hypothetical protein